MAEDGLDGANVSAVSKHLGRETVTERMRRDGFGDAGFAR